MVPTERPRPLVVSWGPSGDVPLRIDGLNVQPLTGGWRSLRGPLALRQRLLVGLLCAGRPGAPTQRGRAVLHCSISAQFHGIAQFSTRRFALFLAALHLSAALGVPSARDPSLPSSFPLSTAQENNRAPEPATQCKDASGVRGVVGGLELLMYSSTLSVDVIPPVLH